MATWGPEYVIEARQMNWWQLIAKLGIHVSIGIEIQNKFRQTVSRLKEINDDFIDIQSREYVKVQICFQGLEKFYLPDMVFFDNVHPGGKFIGQVGYEENYVSRALLVSGAKINTEFFKIPYPELLFFCKEKQSRPTPDFPGSVLSALESSFHGVRLEPIFHDENSSEWFKAIFKHRGRRYACISTNTPRPNSQRFLFFEKQRSRFEPLKNLFVRPRITADLVAKKQILETLEFGSFFQHFSEVEFS